MSAIRAVICRENGDPSVLRIEEIPAPKLSNGGVRIAVEAAGLNFADTLVVKGAYQIRPPFPFTPGLECAGVVREVAPDVKDIKVGDRVMAAIGMGCFAEEIVARAVDVFPVPKNGDLSAAGAFPIVYGTAHGALDYRARLKAGETLLVLGAGGGVGLAAVEVGKAMGAKVIAAARGADKLARAREHGADHVIDYVAEDLRARIKDVTADRGADVIFDPVGGDAFDAALRAIAWEGRLLVVGFASGRIPQVPANLLLVKNVSAIGVFWGGYRQKAPKVVRDSFAKLNDWWRHGKLRPHISHCFDIADVASAMNLLLSRRTTGKIVLTTGRS
ncbi:MAG TPA: NADPH:quinone oxidoreductase family protein [Alphaproteobacteria bacterium]|nr:NADPH:quinone oxidoreductase family protein [Alphaproteobacteria bacterium]